jgi:hypothetical protein
VATLVGQRVFGIALGYEDLIDHDQLRHDPVLAVLAGKLEAGRVDCAPLAGKSTLIRLEHPPSGASSRYHRIGHDGEAIERLFVDLFLAAHARAPKQIILDLDATDDPIHGDQEGRFFHGYYDGYCYLPLYVFCGRHLIAAKLRRYRPGSGEVAAGSHPAQSRFGLRPRGADALVRTEPGRLRVRARPQSAPRRGDRGRTHPSRGGGRAHEQAGPALQGLALGDARSPRGRAGGA